MTASNMGGETVKEYYLTVKADAPKITGTPSEFGTFSVKVMAVNNAKTVTKTLKMIITSPPAIDDIILPNAIADKSYTQKITASGTNR